MRPDRNLMGTGVHRRHLAQMRPTGIAIITTITTITAITRAPKRLKGCEAEVDRDVRPDKQEMRETDCQLRDEMSGVATLWTHCKGTTFHLRSNPCMTESCPHDTMHLIPTSRPSRIKLIDDALLVFERLLNASVPPPNSKLTTKLTRAWRGGELGDQ